MHRWVYYPDHVEHWQANTPSAGNAGYVLLETIPHSLGVVPILPVGHEDVPSVIDDLLTIQDAINKLLTDMLIASEYSGRPRRWASGIEGKKVPVLDESGEPVTDPETGDVLTDTVSPFPEGNRFAWSEEPDGRFGSLPAAQLDNFESGIKTLISQAMMVSGLPAHYVGLLQDSVTSADALRAAEAALVARCEGFQRIYGVGWEAVARVLVAIRDNVDPATVTARFVWSPADTRSQAQEADYAVKLYQSGILSRRGVLKRLGLTADEVDEELANMRDDAQVGHDLKFAAFTRDLGTMSGKPAERPAA